MNYVGYFLSLPSSSWPVDEFQRLVGLVP